MIHCLRINLNRLYKHIPHNLLILNIQLSIFNFQLSTFNFQYCKALSVFRSVSLARHMQPHRSALIPFEQHLVKSAVVLNPCRPFSSLLRRYNPYISCLAPAVLAVLHTANRHVQLRTTIPRINMNRSTNIIPQRLQHLKTQAP